MDEFLGAVDRERTPSARFERLGDWLAGDVRGIRRLDDRMPDGTVRVWPDGRPMSVWVFTLARCEGPAAGGNAEVSLWVRGNLVTALREAARVARVGSLVGRRVRVEHHQLGDRRGGFQAPKLFRAQVTGEAEPVVDDDAPF